ncbi:MAG: hypothetical protein US30_C0007G0024 [Candidatus Moranbacteria bacterium GW2011_GWF2_36_839]|nr:MAG: hypothetical protein US27_C0007G0026 [Candidatus Moranbacteria bacterium GW2011_GWF1_36_78]KKQ17078.1 MAG: hypothetical protein US30_C0007G0024 [Candidatus Moranbacteria bacterium GW2011_GWF2_36_839]HAT73681.1 hypothetical protein [Candidatus Moranbacteria bacterium]HBY11343.1 hypothetical protein [Candidatus Moranbacteria bacterium]
MENQIEFLDSSENKIDINKKAMPLEKSNKILGIIFLITTLINIFLLYLDEPSKGLDLGLLIISIPILIVGLGSVLILIENLFKLNTIKTGHKHNIILKISIFVFIVIIYMQFLVLFGK